VVGIVVFTVLDLEDVPRVFLNRAGGPKTRSSHHQIRHHEVPFVSGPTTRTLKGWHQVVPCETYPLRLKTLAGLPTAVAPGGTSRVTTLPAPTIASSPMLTPGKTIAPPPIQTFRAIRTGAPLS